MINALPIVVGHLAAGRVEHRVKRGNVIIFPGIKGSVLP